MPMFSTPGWRRPSITEDTAYTPSGGSASRGRGWRFAVGKPSVRPRRSPRTARPRAAHLAPVHLDGSDDVHAEAQPRAERLQRLHRSGAIAAEPDVVADDHVHHLEVSQEEVLDELLGRERREG